VAGPDPDELSDEIAKDYTAQAHGRVILQYRESPKLLGFIDALMAPVQDIENALVTIPALDDVDLATGVNLDVTGDLVGQGRELVNGDVSDDPAYRVLIKARISRNTSHSTGEEVLKSLQQLFGTPPTVLPMVLWDFGGMAMGYAIGRALTADEIAILSGPDIIARPMGVQVSMRETFDPLDYFGFDDDPGATGFADDSAGFPGVGGGRLAEEF
jgi:Protein of unknown function (DUF2612)